MQNERNFRLFDDIKEGDHVVVSIWHDRNKAVVTRATATRFEFEFTNPALNECRSKADRTLSKITGRVVGDSNSDTRLEHTWNDGGRLITWEDLDAKAAAEEAAKARRHSREVKLSLANSKVAELSDEQLDALLEWLNE